MTFSISESATLHADDDSLVAKASEGDTYHSPPRVVRSSRLGYFVSELSFRPFNLTLDDTIPVKLRRAWPIR